MGQDACQADSLSTVPLPGPEPQQWSAAELNTMYSMSLISHNRELQVEFKFLDDGPASDPAVSKFLHSSVSAANVATWVQGPLWIFQVVAISTARSQLLCHQFESLSQECT